MHTLYPEGVSGVREVISHTKTFLEMWALYLLFLVINTELFSLNIIPYSSIP